jgi:hypothetical protein
MFSFEKPSQLRLLINLEIDVDKREINDGTIETHVPSSFLSLRSSGSILNRQHLGNGKKEGSDMPSSY